MYKNAALAAVLLYPFLSLAEKDIFIAVMSGNYGGNYIHKIKFILSSKGEDVMSVELYALFSYAFTAAIALFMIGIVVLLNKIMGGSEEGGEQ